MLEQITIKLYEDIVKHPIGLFGVGVGVGFGLIYRFTKSEDYGKLDELKTNGRTIKALLDKIDELEKELDNE